MLQFLYFCQLLMFVLVSNYHRLMFSFSGVVRQPKRLKVKVDFQAIVLLISIALLVKDQSVQGVGAMNR